MTQPLDNSAYLAKRRAALTKSSQELLERAHRSALAYAQRPSPVTRRLLVLAWSRYETAAAFLEAISS